MGGGRNSAIAHQTQQASQSVKHNNMSQMYYHQHKRLKNEIPGPPEGGRNAPQPANDPSQNSNNQDRLASRGKMQQRYSNYLTQQIFKGEEEPNKRGGSLAEKDQKAYATGPTQSNPNQQTRGGPNRQTVARPHSQNRESQEGGQAQMMKNSLITSIGSPLSQLGNQNQFLGSKIS
mmetsp:Transcript_28248/g.42761  ORF Transcript_28248/g.42761 Transcript_28248/m.42761 type:complete len:176 (-) Transcript_28248:27-554(-)